jgi:hypothetical protein
VRALLLAALVAVAPALAAAQDEDLDDEAQEEDGRNARRLSVIAWGGQGFDTSGTGKSGARFGGEVTWAFDSLDVGLAGYGYRRLRDATREWTPVTLVRLTQRFETARGLDAAVTLGLGAARPDDWVAWFLFGLGLRLDLGPMFLAGELAFEQRDQLRLMAGLGARF